jgi:uncharacterized protein DUF4115
VIAAYEGRNDAPRKRTRSGAPPPPPPRRPQEPIRIQPLSPTPVDTRVRYAPSFWLMGLLAGVLLIAAYLAYNTFTGIREAPAQEATPTTLARATMTPIPRPSVMISNTPVWTPFPTPGGVQAAGTPVRPPPPAGQSPVAQTTGVPFLPFQPGVVTPLPGASGSVPPPLTAVAQTTPSPGAGVTVQVTVGSQNAWMLVKVDGATVWGATLAAGSTKTWVGQNTIRIRFARADITSVTVNGVDKGLAGDSSQLVVTKEWDAAGNEHVISSP